MDLLIVAFVIVAIFFVGLIMALDALIGSIWFVFRIMFCFAIWMACQTVETKHDMPVRRMLMATAAAWAFWISWNAIPEWELYFLFFLCFICMIAGIAALELPIGGLLYLIMPLLLVYLIGFDISNARIDNTNVAYVVAERSGYFFDNIYKEVDEIGDEHKFGYKKGAIFQVLDIDGNQEYVYWFHVKRESDYQEGYMKDSNNIKKIYRRKSEFAKEAEKEYISSKWYYRFIPRPIFRGCQFVYEHLGILCYYDFTD